MASPVPLVRGHYSSGYYYYFLAFAAIALLLFISNMMAVGCCSPCQLVRTIRRFLHLPGGSEGGAADDRAPRLMPVLKYEKDKVQGSESDTECAVCLSVFVDGEEVRQLPECKHSFHAPCIDMWLYSHSNCPLCRANVSLPTSGCPSSVGSEEAGQRLPPTLSRGMARVALAQL